MSSRKVVAGLLIAGIGTCISLLPWARWSGPSQERLLAERVARYIELRKTYDWSGVYNLMDPADRKRRSQLEYMQHISGALQVHSMTEKEHAIDREKGTAKVTLTMDAELIRNNLPAIARNLNTDAGATRKTDDFATEWTWSDGTWWLRMDREVLTGRTADGRVIDPGNGRK